jgi:hypothetical protein
MPHVIEATILTGCAKGEDVFIPRIPLIPTDMPFEFKRLQFQVRLAFAMAINKAQGQSLKVLGRVTWGNSDQRSIFSSFFDPRSSKLQAIPVNF